MDTVDLIIKSSTEFYNDLKSDENGRYRSWEYCYSHFMNARGRNDVDYDYLSLQLAFYLISVMGIVNIKGNISTIHSYNRRRVKEDITKYGKVVGTGTLIIGISLVLGFIVSFWSEEIMGYIILPAIIIGLGLILYGQFKYNKGIF